MNNSLILEDSNRVPNTFANYQLKEGEKILLASVLDDPVNAGKFLTLDELLFLHKNFANDYATLFPSQGKILGGRVKGREHVCSSFWWNGKASGLNETRVLNTLLPGLKGYTNYLLVRKAV